MPNLNVDENKNMHGNNNGAGLGAIEEEEEDDDEDDEDGDLLNSVPSQPGKNTSSFLLEDQDFPHAFSHFSYQMSKGSLMVVDLQGVFTQRPNGTRVYELTDPVIHKKKGRRRFRHWTFGRTDRGIKGDTIDACCECHGHVGTAPCQTPEQRACPTTDCEGLLYAGMHAFFQTHKCSDVCKALGLKEGMA